jgi:hypothetical protein
MGFYTWKNLIVHKMHTKYDSEPALLNITKEYVKDVPAKATKIIPLCIHPYGY